MIYGPGITDIVGAFHAANIPMKAFIVADSNEKRTNEQLILAGFSNLMPAKKWQGSVVDGLRLMKQFKIIVDPDSPEIATSFQNYKWADKKQNVPAHDFSHIPDSIRYPFMVQSLMAGLVIK